MSAAGDEFMKELWRGKVPIQFTLSSSSLVGKDRPSPCYKLVPRVSYIPFFLSDVRSHFQLAAKGSDEVWFSWDDGKGKDLTIPYYLPTGVVFDRLMLREGKEAAQMLPLQLTVHFTSFPEDLLVHLRTDDEANYVFEQSLKQAHLIRYGSTKAVTTLPNLQWDDLKTAVKECNYAKYTQVRAHLTQRGQNEGPQKLPIMVHTPERCLLRSPTVEGCDYTFGHFLRDHIPDYSHLTDSDCIAEACPPPVNDGHPFIHGIAPLASTPLLWLSEYMCYPDGFLHVSLP
eukprot:Sspe_Gene.33202::Locus_16233_Transcript_2_2_Confidence_0.750_Length_949::g.33202::m.33202/K08339/ATG5; autophagy-related protein 5